MNILQPNIDELIAKWGDFADSIEHISPWTGKREICWLAEASQGYLMAGEVGSYKGKSAIALCQGALRVWCIDNFQDSTQQEFEKNLGERGLFPTARLIVGESADGVRKLAKLHVKFDLFFIDASHEKYDVLRDISLWMPLVKSGGILAFHDYYPNDPDNGIAQALEDCFPNSFTHVIDSIAAVRIP